MEHTDNPLEAAQIRRDGLLWSKIPCEVTPLVMRLPKRPCKMYRQINFERHAQLKCIIFRNCYTAYLTVKQFQDKDTLTTSTSTSTTAATTTTGTNTATSTSTSSKGMGERWRTVLHNYQLMADPHFEDDAQIYHTIDVSQFNDKYDPGNVRKLRFYLYQPSPLWRLVDVQEPTCYSVKQLEVRATRRASVMGSNQGSTGDKIKRRVDDMMGAWRQLYA